jgi:hypothetical protein
MMFFMSNVLLASMIQGKTVHQNGSVKAAAGIEDGLAQRLEF